MKGKVKQGWSKMLTSYKKNKKQKTEQPPLTSNHWT
jgi:hypothetical protein